MRRTERLWTHGMAHQVVAIERDVERPGRHVVPVDLFEGPGEPPRQWHAAGADADQRQLIEPAVPLENLVRDARQRARHPIGVHHLRHTDLRIEKRLSRIG